MRRGGPALGGAEGSALATVSVCFFLGGVAGCLLAGSMSGEGSAGLESYLRGVLTAAEVGETVRPELWTLLWEVLRWPVLVWILSCTAAGIFAIPGLFAVRGFLLSFALSSFVKVLGGEGELLSILVLGLPQAAAIPGLFVLGTGGLLSSRLLARRPSGEGAGPGEDRLVRCGVCAGGSVLCILLEYFALPVLLPAAVGIMAGG